MSSNPLLDLENQALEEGREWTRKRFEELLQQQADEVPPYCPESKERLEMIRYRRLRLKTCAGDVCISVPYGYSRKLNRWINPVREWWGLEPNQVLSAELQKRVCFTATQVGSYERAAKVATCWGTEISDDAIHKAVEEIGTRAADHVPAAVHLPHGPFSLVIMMDGWMVRERGERWGFKPPEIKLSDRIESEKSKVR